MRLVLSLLLLLPLALTAAAGDGEFGGKTGAEWLKILKESKEVKARRAGLIALEVIGARKGVVLGIGEAMSTDADAETRREAALVLGRIDPVAKEAVAALGDVLGNPKEDGSVREAAAQALGAKLVDFAGTQVLVLGRALKDPHPPVRRAAAETLQNMRDKAREAYPQLLAFVQSGKEEAVATRFAMQAISRFKELSEADKDEVVGALNKVALDAAAEEGVRESALEALGHMKSEKGSPGLSAGLKAKEVALRRIAARGLVQLKEKAKEAWPALKGALADEDSTVRNHAILASGNIGKDEPAAVKELIQVGLKDRDLDNRIAAIEALGIVGPSASAAEVELERLARDDVRARVREAAKAALGKIKGS